MTEISEVDCKTQNLSTVILNLSSRGSIERNCMVHDFEGVEAGS